MKKKQVAARADQQFFTGIGPLEAAFAYAPVLPIEACSPGHRYGRLFERLKRKQLLLGFGGNIVQHDLLAFEISEVRAIRSPDGRAAEIAPASRGFHQCVDCDGFLLRTQRERANSADDERSERHL